MGQAHSRSELLWQMSGYGNKGKVQEILAEGVADPNWVSLDDNSTALMVAAGSKKGDVELIRWLLDAGADVAKLDNRDNLALHHAAMRGQGDVIKALVQAGSDVNAQNRQGWSPLMNACYWCQPDAAAVLLEAGAQVDILNNEKRSVLHELCRSPLELYTCKEVEVEAPREGRRTIEELREERKRREERERHSDDSESVLRETKEAEMKKKREDELAEIACMLLDAGCEVNMHSQSYGEEDFTPLLYAAYHNHTEIALVLTQCEDQTVNLDYQGGANQWSALHWASDRGNGDMVLLLLDAGADPWRRGRRGELAADRSADHRIRTLLLNAQNKNPEATPIPTIVTTTPTPTLAPDSGSDALIQNDDDSNLATNTDGDVTLDLAPLTIHAAHENGVVTGSPLSDVNSSTENFSSTQDAASVVLGSTEDETNSRTSSESPTETPEASLVSR